MNLDETTQYIVDLKAENAEIEAELATSKALHCDTINHRTQLMSRVKELERIIYERCDFDDKCPDNPCCSEGCKMYEGCYPDAISNNSTGDKGLMPIQPFSGQCRHGVPIGQRCYDCQPKERPTDLHDEGTEKNIDFAQPAVMDAALDASCGDSVPYSGQCRHGVPLGQSCEKCSRQLKRCASCGDSTEKGARL